MLVYLIRRLAQSILVLLVMAVLVFIGIFAVGNPVDVLINPEADLQEQQATIERLGLDLPLHEQLFVFMGNAVKGDFGRSFLHGEPAMEIILTRLPATMELAVVALAISLVFGVLFGLWAGLKPYAVSGKTIMAGSILGFSLPNFWQGLMLILIFAVFLGWLPAGGRGETTEFLGMRVSFLTADGWSHILLPALNLAIFKMCLVIRLARAGTREAALQDYVKFARAKGLSPRRIVLVHILKNIMIPVVTVVGLELGSMIAFAVVTETVFAWPGIGKLLIDSIVNLDRPVVVAYLVLTVFMFVIINLTVDLIYSVLDPRVRLAEVKA
jgi:peptide/nickel transport system permease protein